MGQQRHLVTVEAYQGILEFATDEPEKLAAAEGLGLPLDDIAAQMGCRVTVLCWDEWLRYELAAGSPLTGVPTPATRPTAPRESRRTVSVFSGPRVARIPIPARDPVFGRAFSEGGFSSQSYGLIANNDLMFFVSYCLRQELTRLAHQDPFDAVILPMYGGLGYLSQLARATGAEPSLDVPFVIVATDTSARRQVVNHEGYWGLEATIRRQMEDVSLALADEVLAFGSRGLDLAAEGRLPESTAPVIVPRRVAASVIDGIAEAADRESRFLGAPEFFLYEPQHPAAGVLTALDALNLLYRQGIRLPRPVISAGPSMIFAPMTPRDFQSYWSTRGFVRELLQADQWRWQRQRPTADGGLPVRLCPSGFEHLPDIWTELARGSLALLSPAAAEGLGPAEALPREVLLPRDPTPEDLAAALQHLADLDPQARDEIRRRLCRQVVGAYRSDGRRKRLEETVTRLDQLLQVPPPPQDLARMGLLFLDRRRSLRVLAAGATPASLATGQKRSATTLSVVVTCYEMGSMITEAVESVWVSTRVPDELLVIDDGSRDEQTLHALQHLEQAAAERRLPLRVIRQDNTGLTGARNVGLEAARSELISFLDGDDRIGGKFYELAVQLHERYPGLGGVAAWAYCFDERGVTGFWNAPQPELPLLLIENGVIVPCVSRTEVLRALSGYDPRQRYNYEDWELSVRVLTSGRPIITIPLYLLDYRERVDSMFRSMTEVQNQIMRERLFDTHRETVTRFGVEVAMLMEHRLMRRFSRDKAAAAGARGHSHSPSIRDLGRIARSTLGSARRYLRRLTGGKAGSAS